VIIADALISKRRQGINRADVKLKAEADRRGKVLLLALKKCQLCGRRWISPGQGWLWIKASPDLARR